MIGTSLTITLETHKRLLTHLFPGDGLEAAAVVLCSRAPGPRLRLLAAEVILVPYEGCKSRKSDYLTWPGSVVEEAIDKAEQRKLSVILMHSHPGGLFDFSPMDDASDLCILPSLHAAIDQLHGTAVMLKSGAVRARVYNSSLRKSDIEQVVIPGVDVVRYWVNEKPTYRPLAFTHSMRNELSRLTALVIGVSGTGSIVAEQLARLGLGKVLLVDHDHVEGKNLNRILNSTLSDAAYKTPKVEMFAQAIESYRGAGVALPLKHSITEREAITAAGQCDVVFSCVDRLDARYYADQIATCFLIPLFDVGVSIPTRRIGESVAIAEACTRIDYVRPGGPTLGDRGVYTPESLQAEELRDTDPDAYADQLKAGYFKGINEQAPDVIALNMRAAADCILEFLARCYGFRHDGNAEYARSISMLSACETEVEGEQAFRVEASPSLARGDHEPLLGLPRFRHGMERPL